MTKETLNSCQTFFSWEGGVWNETTGPPHNSIGTHDLEESTICTVKQATEFGVNIQLDFHCSWPRSITEEASELTVSIQLDIHHLVVSKLLQNPSTSFPHRPFDSYCYYSGDALKPDVRDEWTPWIEWLPIHWLQRNKWLPPGEMTKLLHQAMV